MRIPAADAAVADVDATGAARGGGAITMELFTKEHTLRTKSASKAPFLVFHFVTNRGL